MSTKRLFALLTAGLFLFPAVARALPPNPARIGGTVTFINAVQVKSADTVRYKERSQLSDGAFTFSVTRPDGSGFDPVAADTDGLNSQDLYVMDIPIYQAVEQPGGALPGDTARVRVFMNDRELEVVSPPAGRIIVGNSGSITPVDLVVQDVEQDEILYTRTQLDQAVSAAVEKWDVGSNGVVDLREAIHALAISAGVSDPVPGR